ncbi:hypothetical protein BOX15_Mlig010157g1, partial [Macrostomum lignano]
ALTGKLGSLASSGRALMLLRGRLHLSATAAIQQQQQQRRLHATPSVGVLGLQEKPTRVTIPEASHGGMMSKSQHWTVERVLTVGMLPLYPAALMMDGLAMNLAVGAAITMHVYWGIEAVIKDYAMERLYGPQLQKILYAVWKVISLIGFAGFVYFCYTDVGFIRVVKDLWTV